VNRFLSKLDLRDIKIDPRGSRFPPDADDAPAEDDVPADHPSLRQAKADEAEAVVRGEDWELGHDPTRTAAATGAYSPDDDDDDAAPADDDDAATTGDGDTGPAGDAGPSTESIGDHSPHEATMGTSGNAVMGVSAAGSATTSPAGPPLPAAIPARNEDRPLPVDRRQRDNVAIGDDRVQTSTAPSAPDRARDADSGMRGGVDHTPHRAVHGEVTGDANGGADGDEGGSYAPTTDVLKVSARSRPSAVAGAIAGVVRELGRAEVQAIGAGATNQAIKAVAIARDYLQENGIEAVCIPAFIDVTIENEDRTAMLLVIEPR